MEMLTKNVFVKTGTRGCNPGGVITSEGIVLIDVPGDPAYVDEYIAEISQWGKVRYIINTEYHFDHNMTNGYFDAPVIASEITMEDHLMDNDVLTTIKIIECYVPRIPHDQKD